MDSENSSIDNFIENSIFYESGIKDRLEYRNYDPYLDEELLDGFITPDLEELE